ncbi:type VII secretion-associated serine protease mycosin [Streptomyces sp. TRM43335]|uniref:Type VII secretion-associated serine protease mycosin n=1 Tax=Streptomyces taklimakanensis TaxID=2569853 RepID=A0A6G2BGM7_9ACTN|nr:type VII secretion-associated serine protease mycosin [Streptomyces taklimakanensis]MTE21276.1 type VII secretion-associated serine protease mycosin [Streptomyces taklimakanensis]
MTHTSTTTPASGTGAVREPGPARTPRRWTALPTAAALGVAALGAVAAPLAWAPPAAADTGQCTFPAEPFEGRPWSLKRVLLDQLWEKTKGRGVKVAVIDTGVDDDHPQLKDAVDAELGKRFLKTPEKDEYGNSVKPPAANGTDDTVGHGTKVAGIIAARPADNTGFVGIAPEATIIPIQQNDAQGNGDTTTMARSIEHAVEAGAKVINISQDTSTPLKPNSDLEQAVNKALAEGVVIVASAGNDGLGGNVKETYPASYEGVIAVASSDRNNERAPFSQSGDFVDVAAPGVDMISTVPGGGHCADNGTSFSAPYVAGVAALLVAEHPDWEPRHVAAQIAQTAERSVPGHDRHVGWGVIDPVRALTEDDRRIEEPVAREGVDRAEPPTPAELHLGETPQERDERLGTYAVVGGGVLVSVIAGGSLVHRDWRRRRETH